MIPEVNEAVLQLCNCVPRYAHVGIAPFKGEWITNVVAADEGNTVVDDHDLAVITTCLAQVEGKHSRTDFRETADVKVGSLGEDVKEWVLVHDSKAVVNDVHVDPALRCGYEC